MNGRGRQIVLTLLLGALPAGILILTLWAYDILVEHMRVSLHDARSHSLRMLPIPGVIQATEAIIQGSATGSTSTATTAFNSRMAAVFVASAVVGSGNVVASETRESSGAVPRGYPTAFLPDGDSPLVVLNGDWPVSLDAEALRSFRVSLGSSTEIGVPIEGKGLEPSFLWIVPIGSGSRVAVQSRRQFYGRLESLRVIIWIGGLLLIGASFVLIVMVSRKLSDVFFEMEAKNRELERANRHLEDLGTLKSNFLALVSHELRTPLARLSGQVNLIRPDVNALPPDLKGRFELMVLDVEELNRMTKNVLDLTRLQSEDLAARMCLAQIGPLVGACVKRIMSFAVLRDITVECELPETPPVCHDAYLLERILDNLLINAVKYSPESGWINISLQEGDSTVEVRVESSGPVIITADRDRIFEKFYRVEGGADIPGTGLGLYLVRQFILMMNGRAWVEPLKNGNRFAITLPLG
ncbi:MAG: hypothetical protein HQM09_05100 [Candidatus Riflebacteria bacterium]|nr:hypothetical protein [Candidatus Riflebacteria bacterium]